MGAGPGKGGAPEPADRAAAGVAATGRRLRLLVAYDGAPFSGFARQRDRRTVQGELEAALSRLAKQPVLTVGAGRTDAGVHARGQVVHADVPARLDPERVRRALRDALAMSEQVLIMGVFDIDPAKRDAAAGAHEPRRGRPHLVPREVLRHRPRAEARHHHRGSAVLRSADQVQQVGSSTTHRACRASGRTR